MINNIIKQKHYTNQTTNTLQQQKIQHSKILALISSKYFYGLYTISDATAASLVPATKKQTYLLY